MNAQVHYVLALWGEAPFPSVHGFARGEGTDPSFVQVVICLGSAASIGCPGGRWLDLGRTMGAITGRMTHSDPNMANVVASYKPYGKESRGCWTVEDTNNYSLVGVDAKGLELRMLAHYMNDAEFTNAMNLAIH